jgi:hypothetical protein
MAKQLHEAGAWLQQLKLFALTAGDGGLPVWFDVLSGGTGDSTTYAPQFAAFSDHARLARFLPLEDVILIGDRKMPTTAPVAAHGALPNDDIACSKVWQSCVAVT